MRKKESEKEAERERDIDRMREKERGKKIDRRRRRKRPLRWTAALRFFRQVVSCQRPFVATLDHRKKAIKLMSSHLESS